MAGRGLSGLVKQRFKASLLAEVPHGTAKSKLVKAEESLLILHGGVWAVWIRL